MILVVHHSFSVTFDDELSKENCLSEGTNLYYIWERVYAMYVCVWYKGVKTESRRWETTYNYGMKGCETAKAVRK